MGTVAGTVSREFAAAAGVPAGIPVAAGGADAYMGVIGVNALKSGQAALITGSSHLHIGLSETELHAPGLFGSFPDALIPGYAVSLGSAVAGAAAAQWFASVQEAAGAMVRPGRRIDPDPAVTEVYRSYVDQYEATYQALQTLSEELVRTIG